VVEMPLGKAPQRVTTFAIDLEAFL